MGDMAAMVDLMVLCGGRRIDFWFNGFYVSLYLFLRYFAISLIFWTRNLNVRWYIIAPR